MNMGVDDNNLTGDATMPGDDSEAAMPLDYASFEGVGSTESLKSRAIRGSAWTFAGSGVSQVLRLASNLILTRLLFPEAFGLMALVNAFLHGLQMFSDLGLSPSIIHNKRGDDPKFLNTAWTIQMCRGACLFACTCFFGWIIAMFYQQPELFGLIPAAGCTVLISGFTSTNLFRLDRHLQLGKRTAFDLFGQICNIVAAILLAWWLKNVWALVFGRLFGEMARLVVSHALLPGERNRFTWDPAAGRELFHFGRWIFLATVMGFVVGRSDRLILGKLMSMDKLGQYAIAFALSQMVVLMMRQFGNRVLFPLYTRLKEDDPSKLRQRTFWIRAALMSAVLPPVCVFSIWGDWIVRFLYDPRYHEAGWMLQILAIGAVGAIVGLTINPVLLAVGDSFRHMLSMTAQAAITLAAMAVGGWYAGAKGVIIGITVSRFLNYPVSAFFVRRYGVWLPMLDLSAFGVSGAVILIGWYLTNGL